jgi:hypothetical protein
MRLNHFNQFKTHDGASYTIRFLAATQLHTTGEVYTRSKLYLKSSGFLCFSINDRETSVCVDQDMLDREIVVIEKESL